MNATERMASFVCQPHYDSMPAEAIAVAKHAILDCVGVILAGSLQPAGRIITGYVGESGGKGEAGVIGGGFRCPSDQAALANGTMAHAMDYDDMHSKAHCHATAILVPTILALGEQYHATGDQVLEAYSVALEVIYRIGHEFDMYPHTVGFHPTAVSGPMGAAAASARLLKLDKDQTRMAFGIAASETAGIRGNFGSMTKPFHAGNAARSGIVAARLAQRGFTADKDTFDSDWGFMKAFGPKGHVDRDRFVDGLGTVFHGHVGLEFKLYPSCGKTHSALDAMLHLIKEHDLTADKVAEVECATSDSLPEVLLHHRPRTGMEGKFSLEFCMAIALIDGEVGVRQFTDEKVNEPRVQDLIKRVKYVHPEDRRGWGEKEFLSAETVTVRLKNGQSLSYRAARGIGQLGQVVSAAQLEAKYRDCAAPVLKGDSLQKSVRLLRTLEGITDITELTNVICLVR